MAGRSMRSMASERELQAMAVLWDSGSGTVAEVRETLNDRYDPDVAYTTVLTMLRSLRAKGWVRVEEEGKAHRFIPIVPREVAQSDSLHRLTQMLYGGSRELLLTQLVSARGLRPAELQRLRDLLDQRLKRRNP
jgi:BlaI family penicillinase repressor